MHKERRDRRTAHNVVMMAAVAMAAALGCSSGDDKSTSEHEVYFVGYAYNGATGARLTKVQIAAISLRYRDKLIATTIEDDGRFVTTTALPTWQDYAVYITAPGFRPFVSRNAGLDVPASLAMTEALAGAKTVQTFQVEASLFPQDLKAPKVTLTIDQSDAATTTPPPPRAIGSIRLKPQSQSVLEASAGQVTTTTRRRWTNDEDLLTQTLTKPFVDGKAELLEGELLYGVPYQITVFGVSGYQPMVVPDPLVAGQVSSRTLVIAKEQQDPLRVVLMDADACVPPAGNLADFGATINIDFNTAVEFVGANAAEDLDNGVIVSPAGTFSGSVQICPLHTSASAMMQERGTRATIAASRLTLQFNPSVGFATTTASSFPCTLPASLTSVTYANLAAVVLRPVGDQSRKRTLADLVGAFLSSTGSPSAATAVTCGTRASAF